MTSSVEMMFGEKLYFARQVVEVMGLTIAYNTVKLAGNLIDDKHGTIEQQVGHLLGQRIMAHLDLDVRVEGAEQVDRLWRSGEPYAVVSTHASYLDWALLLGHFPTPVRFIAKQELANMPGIGSYLKQRGVLIDRAQGMGAREAIKAAIADDIKWPILIFPEGTRSFDGLPQPFRRGGLSLLGEAGLTFLPVTIVGTHHAAPRGKMIVRPGGRVGLLIGDPVSAKDFPEVEARIDEVERRIRTTFDETMAAGG